MHKINYLISLIILLFFWTACEQEPLTPQYNQSRAYTSDIESFDLMAQDRGRAGVRVMTRNIYIGTDVDVVLSAENPEDIPVLAAQALQVLIETNFPERAIALAKEIALTKPDLIGLQEVTTIRIQEPGDAIVGGTTPAEKVLINYLDVFMATLDALGLNYKVAGFVENADVELPYVAGVDPLIFNDVRVTDYDIILVKEGHAVSNVESANYNINLIIPDLGAEILRGYVAADVQVGLKKFRFVITHLEPFLLEVRLAQTSELLTLLANETLPLIVVGDFNTVAPVGETYQMMLSNGYIDTWNLNALSDDPDGFTFGHDPNLKNETANFDERIDYIFVGKKAGLIDPVFSLVVGDEEFNRTPSGLWPSDHGGVVARLRFPVPFVMN